MAFEFHLACGDIHIRDDIVALHADLGIRVAILGPRIDIVT
jgi:hypothetical protein